MPPAPCPDGYQSDGNGQCVSINITVVCPTGFEKDDDGICEYIAPPTENP